MDSGLLSRVRVSLEAALGLIKTLADGSSVKELLVKAKAEAVVLQVLCCFRYLYKFVFSRIGFISLRFLNNLLEPNMHLILDRWVMG